MEGAAYRWTDIDSTAGVHAFDNIAPRQRFPMRMKKKSRSPDKKSAMSRCSSITNKLKKIISENNGTAKRKSGGGLDGMHASGSAKHLSKNSLTDKVPTVYKFKDIYERRRRELAREIEAAARKQRQFHSRPVPDFSRYHKQIESRTTVHSITVPITPTTLRISIEAQKKLQAQRDQWQRQEMQKPKFKFHSTAYLHRVPFMPKHSEKVIVQKPFNLVSAERAKLRKAYNVTVKNAIIERRYAEKRERERMEREQAKQMRKQATFKATANPWKRIRTKIANS